MVISKKARTLTSVRNAGFSLLEILVVMFIIGLGASFVMPRLVRRAPNIEWPNVRDEMNNMLYFARQEAITTQKVHRLVFDQKKRVLTVQVDAGKDSKGKHRFTQTESMYFTSTYELPEQLSLRSVTMGKKQLLEESKDRKAYCYVVPHGLVQAVEVTFDRNGIGDEERKAFMKIKVAPFLGSFEVMEQVG